MAIQYVPKNPTNEEVEKIIDYEVLEKAQEVILKYRPNTVGYPAVAIIEMDKIKSELNNSIFEGYLAETYPNSPEVAKRIVKR